MFLTGFLTGIAAMIIAETVALCIIVYSAYKYDKKD